MQDIVRIKMMYYSKMTCILEDFQERFVNLMILKDLNIKIKLKKCKKQFNFIKLKRQKRKNIYLNTTKGNIFLLIRKNINT